jgi:hypothetical protein
MHSADVLCTLRSLNQLILEAEALPPGSVERESLEIQASEMRDWLPMAIADHHDFLARSGRRSLLTTDGSCCSGCRTMLDSGLIERLASLGRFVVCPTCQVLLSSPETMGAESCRLIAAGKMRRP